MATLRIGTLVLTYGLVLLVGLLPHHHHNGACVTHLGLAHHHVPGQTGHEHGENPCDDHCDEPADNEHSPSCDLVFLKQGKSFQSVELLAIGLVFEQPFGLFQVFGYEEPMPATCEDIPPLLAAYFNKCCPHRGPPTV